MNRKELRALEAELNGELLLGHTRTHAAYLSLEDLKETSVHVVGAAGFGKSFYLRHLIDQLVIHKQPFGVIDPHTELYEYALWRLRRAGVQPERIVPLDPSDDRFAIGFNPLKCGIDDPGETASMVLEAFLKAWGAQSFDNTPRLERILRGTFRLLIENQLTLLEGDDILGVDNTALRRVLRERLSDRFVRQDWEEFEKLAKSEKLAVVESSRNRLRRVLQAEPLRLMLAQTRETLDLRAVLDDGKFLLANLGGIEAPETQRLIGALLVNGLFHAAKRRNSRRRRDWFLICDEFGQFATRDFANSLDQLRKFGVHLILAHQRLQQLEREDPDVLSSVMTNAKVKVVLGGLERPEAERLAPELFTGQARGDRVKHIAVQTKFRPISDTFDVETHSSTEIDNDTESEGWSSNRASGGSTSEGDAFDESEEDIRRSHSRSDSSSKGSSESSSRSRSKGKSQGHSSSRVPITRHEEFHEETGRQFWSLDEEWEHFIGEVHSLKKREALIRVYSGGVHRVRTPDIEPEQVDERLERFKTKVLQSCSCVKTTEVVTAEIETRQKLIAESVDEAGAKGVTRKIKSFRE